MGLPKISGEDLFRRIKLMNPEVRFILATGYIESELKSELLGLGVCQVIQRPYQPTEILRTLREILDRPWKNIGR